MLDECFGDNASIEAKFQNVGPIPSAMLSSDQDAKRERRRAAGTIPPRCVNRNRIEPWPLPKARPISCNDSPPFQRRHMSILCSVESLSRFPCAINTTLRKCIHIRWCCTDRLRPPDFSGGSLNCGQRPYGRVVATLI